MSRPPQRPPRHRTSSPKEKEEEDMFGRWALGWSEGYWRELEPYLYRLAEDEGLQPHYSAAFGRLRDDHRVGDIVVDLETRYKRSGPLGLVKAICDQLDAPCQSPPTQGLSDQSMLGMDEDTLDDEVLAIAAEERQWKSLVLAATIGLYQILLTTAYPSEGDEKRIIGEFYLHGDHLRDLCRSYYPE